MQFDHGLRKHLLAAGVPTAEPMTAASGQTSVLADGRASELYPFVDGRPFSGTCHHLGLLGSIIRGGIWC